MKEPDKWCIKVTPENREAIEKWRTAKVTLNCRGYCVNKNFFDPSIGYWYPDKPEGYTEISFEEFKVYTSKSKDLTGRYVKCLINEAQGTNCKAGRIYKLVSLVGTMETQIYAIKNGATFHISPITNNAWELLPEDHSADKPLKQAVHCETQEEWDFACDKYDKITGVKTQFGKEYNTFSYTSSFRGWNTKEYYIKENYQILSFQEWCDLNGYKMEKEVKFEVGKWYKNLGIRNQKNTFGKFKRLSGKNNNEFWMSECIYDGKQVDIEEQWLNYSSGTIEASIEEIQQYLPDDHPDKIKPNQEFKVGDWVLIKSANTGNGLPSNLESVFVQLLKIDEDKLPTGHLKDKSDFMVCYNKKYYRTEKWCIIRHATPEEIHGHLAFTGQIQQYSPNNHPDKIKPNQEFKVGDWVLIKSANTGNGLPSNLESVFVQLLKIDEDKLPTGHLKDKSDFMVCYNKKYYRTEKWCIIRHATPEEIHGHLAFTGQIQQYSPNNHPDKIKPNQEFKVGDWVLIKSANTGNGLPSNLESVFVQLLKIDEDKLPTGHLKDKSDFMVCYNKKYYRTEKWCIIRHATPEEIHGHLAFTGQIQQYSPNNHPDKIKPNQEFKVGDWIIVVKECPGYNGQLGKLYKAIENSDDEYFRYEKHSTIDTKLVKIRFATPEEINNHFISIGQISAEKYPFKKLKEDDLTWEIKTEGNQKFKVDDWVVVLEEDNFYPNSEKCPQKLMKIKECGLPYRLLFRDGHTNTYEKIRHATEEEMQEYFRKNEYLLKKKIEAETYEYSNEILDRMKEETSKPSYHLLSIDDEELPMVNIIKTNTIKQLLNND